MPAPRSRSIATFVLAVSIAAMSIGGVACNLQPQGKVAQGQLYMSGEAKFDAYFRDVHAIQVWAAQWPDDRKATRRPLVNILDLTPDAADVTIIQATHEKMVLLTRDNNGGTRLDASVDEAHVIASGGAKTDFAMFRAIEDTSGGELGRAKKLNSMLPKMDDLSRLGQSLEPRIQDTYLRQAPGKVEEVKLEMSASLTVLANVTTKARRSIRECDDFVADLQRAVATGTEAGRRDRKEHADADKPDKADKPDVPLKPPPPDPKPKPKPATPKPPAKPTPPPPSPAIVKKDDATPPPKPTPAAKKDDAPAAKPKPKPDEVFNP